MKTKLFMPLTAFIFALAIVVCTISQPYQQPICQAYDVYDMLTPQLIELYEKEIAECQIVSGKSQRQLERISKTLNISLNKAKAFLLLQDFASRTGDSVSLSTLAKMSDMEIFAFAKQRAEVYQTTITPERKEYLINLIKANLKKK